MPDDDLTIPMDDADDSLTQADDDMIPLLGGEEEEPEEETISLTDPLRGQSAMRAIRSSLEAGRKSDFKRPMNLNGQGATRCRLFHCKVAEAPMEHMESQINDWLDDEGIEVKQVGHVVGMLEGKHTEPNVIVLVWY